MKLLITDTNVFFDLIKCNSLEGFFGVGYEIETTSLVLHEIKNPEQKAQIDFYIRLKKITVIEFEGEELGKVALIKTNRAIKRIADKSVLYVAIQKKEAAILLTGDRALKDEAKEKGLQVHGVIWAMRKIWEAKFYAKQELINRLETLMIINERLPKDKIETLIKEVKTERK